MRGGGGEWKILYGKRGGGGWMEDAVRVRSCQEKGSEVTEVVDGIANSSQIPHQARECEEKRSQQRLLRLGMLTAVTLTAHNFPEGMAVAIRYACQKSPVKEPYYTQKRPTNMGAPQVRARTHTCL